ncbi:MAG TPA: M20/M25/M40 family metallo-hydrolase [Bacillota bacterium]
MSVNDKRLLQTFLDLVKISSPSRREGRLAAELKSRLEDLGLKVRVDQAGSTFGGEAGNVFGRWPADADRGQGSGGQGGSNGHQGPNARPAPGPILLCAHMDTVRPTEGLEPRVEGGIVRSDGRHILGADDKGGIAAILEGLTAIHQAKLPHPEVRVLFTVGEEVGLLGAKSAADEAGEAGFAFVLDSGSQVGTIIVETPSTYALKIKVIGRAAHAGVEPEKGVNAIHVAAKAVAALPTGRIDPITTINFGIIEGGTATNIVPPEATVELEARSRDRAALDGLIERVEATFRREANSAGARVNIDKRLDFEGFKLDPEDAVVGVAGAAVRRVGLQPGLVPRGGGSDANVFNAHGLPAVNLGVGPSDEHTDQESLAVDQLVKAAELVVALIEVSAGGR